MLRRAPILIALAITALLLAPEQSDARIFLNKGVTGAHLGMSKAGVKSKLGAPKRVIRGDSDFGRFVEFRYGRLRIVFSDGGRRVNWVATTRKRERTARASE